MPKSIEVKLADYFKMPNPKLKSYFGRVRKGQPLEYRTTFAKGSSVEEVLQSWSPTLTKLETSWPTLVEFENDLRAKVGPMSVMKPLKERMSDIEHYYADILLSAEPIKHSAISAVLGEFSSVRGLNLRDQQRTVLRMRKSTNSGSPYFTKRRDVVSATLPCSVDGDHIMVNNTLWNAAAVLGWRGQEGGPSSEDVKQRVVWMFPFSVNINELQMYQPMIETVQRYNLVPAWVSMDSVDERITSLFGSKGEDDLIICTDFSRFDQHFNPVMQAAAFDIVKGLAASNDQTEAWLESVFPVKYNIPMMFDYGKVFTGIHGMGSGSGGTNADETLVHRALQYEAAQIIGESLNPNSQCLGDDGILSYPGITVDQVVDAYSSHGQEMNTDKQYASKEDCIYLRRWHHRDYRIDGICRGVYSTYRALGRLCEQERYYNPDEWGPKMVALRQLSIIENVKWHPLREEFADFCMKRDKYRLGIDIPGFLDEVDAIAQKAMATYQDFLGYTKTQMSREGGIQTWWIVNYLKSKR